MTYSMMFQLHPGCRQCTSSLHLAFCSKVPLKLTEVPPWLAAPKPRLRAPSACYCGCKPAPEPNVNASYSNMRLIAFHSQHICSSRQLKIRTPSVQIEAGTVAAVAPQHRLYLFPLPHGQAKFSRLFYKMDSIAPGITFRHRSRSFWNNAGWEQVHNAALTLQIHQAAGRGSAGNGEAYTRARF